MDSSAKRYGVRYSGPLHATARSSTKYGQDVSTQNSLHRSVRRIVFDKLTYTKLIRPQPICVGDSTQSGRSCTMRGRAHEAGPPLATMPSAGLTCTAVLVLSFLPARSSAKIATTTTGKATERYIFWK